MPRLFSGGVIHSEGPSGGSAAGLALRACSVIVRSPAPLLVPTNTIVPLEIVSVLWDPEGWANLSNDTILIPEPGLYQLHAFITWLSVGPTDPHAGTFRKLELKYNAPYTPIVQMDDPIQKMTDGQCQERTAYRFLFIGQAAHVEVTQNSGGTMVVTGGSDNPNSFTLIKVA